MKGLKIENIRDPKWIGKKIIVGELSVSPDKLVFVGNGQICTENRFKSLSLWPIDCYDWYEWIEFPFKVGDRIRRKWWFYGHFITVKNISEKYIYGSDEVNGYTREYLKVLDNSYEYV